jgi:dihydroneopterin triphosphate diphosphatase
VQVVIFTQRDGVREYLLLKRLEAYDGFWQPVTGSLEEGETHTQAAVREVAEETGIVIGEEFLINLGIVNTFEIAERWRRYYDPRVTHNEEICFAVRIEASDVRLDPKEHDAFVWVNYQSALRMLYWDSNKRVLTATERMLEQQVATRE